jgi:hypothetical protein
MKTLKRVLTTILISLLVLSLNAQTTAGKLLLGGSSNMGFSASTDKTKDDDLGTVTNSKNLAFNLSPQVGFFVINGLAVGLVMEIDYSSTKYESSNDKEIDIMLVAGPFVRYYFGSSKIKPFVEGSGGFGLYSIKDDPDVGNTITYKYGVMALQGKGGVAFFFNDAVSLELGLGYNYLTSKAKEDNDTNRKNSTGGIGMQIGIMVVL